MASSTRTDGPEQPMSKTAYVLARLREDLASGLINPGQQLRQSEIAERYGVSATPVREALRLLEADGTIDYSPHRGATVAELSNVELRDLYLVRLAVEVSLTGLAAERITSEQLTDIREQHERIAAAYESASPEDLSAWNRDLHLTILRAGSPLITKHVVKPLWLRFLPPSRSQWRSRKVNAHFVEQHEKLVAALEQRDVEAAKACMEAHLQAAMTRREEAARTDPA